MPILNFVHCNDKFFCAYGPIEDVGRVFEDYAANSTLIIESVALILISVVTNSTGVGITKYGSAAQR